MNGKDQQTSLLLKCMMVKHEKSVNHSNHQDPGNHLIG